MIQGGPDGCDGQRISLDRDIKSARIEGGIRRMGYVAACQPTDVNDPGQGELRPMHVLLITPENPFIKAFRQGQFNNFSQLTMPYLAGFVRPPHTVALVDEYNQKVSLDAPADLVGITCNTPNASHVYAMADAFRRRG